MPNITIDVEIFCSICGDCLEDGGAQTVYPCEYCMNLKVEEREAELLDEIDDKVEEAHNEGYEDGLKDASPAMMMKREEN